MDWGASSPQAGIVRPIGGEIPVDAGFLGWNAEDGYPTAVMHRLTPRLEGR